jgi:hypothetical protein
MENSFEGFQTWVVFPCGKSSVRMKQGMKHSLNDTGKANEVLGETSHME